MRTQNFRLIPRLHPLLHRASTPRAARAAPLSPVEETRSNTQLPESSIHLVRAVGTLDFVSSSCYVPNVEFNSRRTLFATTAWPNVINVTIPRQPNLLACHCNLLQPIAWCCPKWSPCSLLDKCSNSCT